MYCISDTSPPNPTTEESANTRRRLTSVKRARDPYDAGERNQESDTSLKFHLTKYTQ